MVPRLQLVSIMRGPIIVSGLALLAACPSGGPPDQPDGGAVDSLSIRFQTDQDLPAMTAADRRLKDAQFHADSVRAIGDAAPGDSRTTESDYRMRWHESDQPDPIRFDEAPAGLYSTVEVRFERGDEEHGFEVEGEALLDAVWVPFEIEDDTALTITIGTSTTLAPGGSATIEIDVDLARIIADIDFSQFPIVEGKIEIGDDDPEIAAIRAAIGEAFAASAQQ
jgi:hypothetical protein